MDVIQETWTTTYPIYSNTVPLVPVPASVPAPIIVPHPPPILHPIVHTVPMIAPTPIIFPVPNVHVAPIVPRVYPVRTIWIVSSSSDRLNNPLDAGAHAQMEQSSPVNIGPSHTLKCEAWPAPPGELQVRYSGVSKQMRDWVKANVPMARAEM